MLEVNNVFCGYGEKTVIKNISFKLNSSEILCVLGPNGSGKSTLFKAIMGLLPLEKGEVLIDNNKIENMTRKDIAKAIGYVPQAHIPYFSYRALDMVLMGRTAHLGIFNSPSKKDVHIAEKVFDLLGITHLQNKVFTEMSGGERQLILIARALAVQPKILIMDEPTNNLDFGNQIMVLNHIKKLADNGIGIIMSSHFPEHAFLYSKKVLLLKKGQIYNFGLPDDIVTEKSLEEIYGVKVDVMDTTTPKGKRVKVCVPWAC